MKKRTIAILFGGKSVEHQISINSAKNIFTYIDKDLFEPIAIGISPTGDWWLKEEINDKFDTAPLGLLLSTSKPGFINLDTNEKIYPDVIFPVLHGTDGEDGSIQGLLQALEIPFAGTGVLGSALSMSKLYSKRLLQSAGIPTSEFVSFSFDEKEAIDFEQLQSKLGIPFMAKAANLGSSVGVVKVKSADDLDHAIKEAFTFDDIILFEAYIEGRELECSVLGNEHPKASLPAEIVIGKDYEFYTYEAKYLDPNAVELKVPASLDSSTTERIQELSLQAYKTLNCEDFARVDLFLKSNGEVLVNEINTIPGFTNSSMFPMMWGERGIPFPQLITEIIELAVARYERNKRISNQYQP